MNLSQASRYFDRIETFDAYSGRPLFKAQLGSFESSNPEGSVAKRRVLSVAPGINLPARRALRLLNEVWIAGDGSQDGLFNDSLRQSFWIRKALGLFTIRTPGQAALGAGGSTAYALREYLKDTVNQISDTRYDAQYDVSFAVGEPLAKGQVLVYGSELLFVRGLKHDLANFLVATSDDIGDAPCTATFTSSTYTPTTDSYASSSTAVPALLLERLRLYELYTQADPAAAPGDRSMLVAQVSLTPVVGQEVAAGGRRWRVQQLTPYQDAWLLHLRTR